MSMQKLQQIKQRRDGALSSLVDTMPYLHFLGIRLERRGDELTAILPFREDLVGNPLLPALHGGATGAFLEAAAVLQLAWVDMWGRMEAAPDDAVVPHPQLPKTIDFTVDFLRSGRPRDAYARARINRIGRRFASVHVEAWQDNRDRLFAQASGHFSVPQT